MSIEQKWPDRVWIVRHGQSAGNVALAQAIQAGVANIDIALRDMDVPLSELGNRQAQAVGQWFKGLGYAEKPSVVLTSPYLRAQETTKILLQTANIKPAEVVFLLDERLRERELGILDRLTKPGIAEKYPEQAEMRLRLGKFYHRPPGGENWCDVLLRLRSVIDTITREFSGERVLIVCHTVVVLCFRYLLEGLNEQTILEIDQKHNIANCGITGYHFDPALSRSGQMALDMFNFVAPLLEAGEKVSTQPDASVAPKG